MTKNELKEAFMESLSLDEGNRNHKKILYGKAKPDLDTITVIPENNCIGILYDLLCAKYSQIGQQDWVAELYHYEQALAHVGVQYLKYAGNFYYLYFKYMFDNRVFSSYMPRYSELDVSNPKTVLDWISTSNNFDFPSNRKVFPFIDHTIFVNRHNNQLLGVTPNGTLAMMDAFRQNPKGRYAQYIDVDDSSEDIEQFIALFIADMSIKCEPKIVRAEESFYKDICGVDLT